MERLIYGTGNNGRRLPAAKRRERKVGVSGRWQEGRRDGAGRRKGWGEGFNWGFMPENINMK
jgi:hypothetical protein